jgi:hypothetical protein
MAKARLNPAQEKQIIRLYTDKHWPWDTHEIAAAFDRSPQGICYVLERNGIKRRNKGTILVRSLGDERHAAAREKQIVSLYRDKKAPWSEKQLAAAYGVRSPTIAKIFERHGVERRETGKVATVISIRAAA